MTQGWLRGLAAFVLIVMTLEVRADEGLVRIDTGRPDARMPAYVMSRPDAPATLILLPGGDAGTGGIVEGKPASSNFLARTRGEFFDAGFNVIVLFRASDLTGLDYAYRASKEHVAEIAAAVEYARTKFARPVWLVGTSRGTVSGAAAAIALGESAVQGLVLTSTVTSRRPGAVPAQDIASLKIPVLVLHHRNDACRVCVPHEAARIPGALKAAPVKKFIQVEGGSDPEGDPCESRHWHGFVNYERETARMVAQWIREPVN